MGDPDQRPSAEPEVGPAEDAEIGEQVPKRRTRKVIKVAVRGVIALASVSALVVTAIAWSTLHRFQGDVSTSKVLADVPGAPSADDAATDFLLVGNDSRTDAQGDPLPLHVLKQLRTESANGLNTDTLILVRVPHNGAAPTAVSIPRDTYAPTDGGRSEKINAVYGLAKTAARNELEQSGSLDSAQVERESNLAGQRALVQSLQSLTGVRVDHYAEVNLLGFFEVTKAIGGVEVCLNQATTDKDSGAEFGAGHQTISGGDALAFVRQRHGLPRGDLDRIVRQQVFMAALANKVLSTGTLTDKAKLDRLMNAATESIVLDEGWNVVGFAQQMQGLAAGGVRFVTLPVTGVGRDDRGQSIITVDPERVRRFVADAALASPPGAGAQPPDRIGPAPLLRLDGTAHLPSHTETPGQITSNGIPCVN